MKMKKPNSLIAIVLGAGVLVGGCFIGRCNQNISNPAPVVARYEGRRGEIQKAVRGSLSDFLTRYVQDIKPFSEEVRNNIDFYNSLGKDGEREVINGYFKLYDSCLSFAVSNINKKISKDDYLKLGKKLAGIHQEMAKKTHLNLGSDDVTGGYAVWGEDKVERYIKIINRNIDTSSTKFEQMFKNTFNKTEGEEEFRKQDKAELILFKGFQNSLIFLFRGFGGKILKETHEKSRELNRREFERIYYSEAIQ